MPARLLPLIALLALMACATRPPLVEARQDAPIAGGAFRLSGVGETPTTAERLAMRGLEARGLRHAAAGEATDYVVQITYADRDRRTGAFIPAEGGEPRWLERDRRRWTLDKGAITLSVRLVELASGREAYVARVVRTYRNPARETDLPTLVDAALAPLKTGSS